MVVEDTEAVVTVEEEVVTTTVDTPMRTTEGMRTSTLMGTILIIVTATTTSVITITLVAPFRGMWPMTLIGEILPTRNA
jgi:hypothetical protein